MTSILSKVQLLATSILHGGMDHEIQAHRTDVVREEVRRLEGGRDALNDELAVNEGSAADLKATIESIHDQITQKTADMQLLLGDDDKSNDGDAEKIGADIIDLQDQLAEKQKELDETMAAGNHLRQTADAVSSKHREMLNKAHTLEAADHITKAENSAAAAISSVASVMGTSVDGSIDDIAAGVHHDAAIANSRLEHAMANIQTSGEDAVRKARLKALMANNASAVVTAIQAKAANANQPATAAA